MSLLEQLHENIYRNDTGKRHHSDGKLNEVEMSKSITLQTLLSLFRYLAGTPDQIWQQWASLKEELSFGFHTL